MTKARFLNLNGNVRFKLLLLAVAAFASTAAYPAFQCEVEVPAGAVGESRTATVTYFNDGTSAIAAPYVRLEAGANAFVRFSETDAWSKSVEFLATSGKSPASSLQAGESVNDGNILEIEFKTKMVYPEFRLLPIHRL